MTSVHSGSIRTNILRDSRGAQAALLAWLGTSRAARVVLRSPAAVARGIVKGIEHAPQLTELRGVLVLC